MLRGGICRSPISSDDDDDEEVESDYALQQKTAMKKQKTATSAPSATGTPAVGQRAQRRPKTAPKETATIPQKKKQPSSNSKKAKVPRVQVRELARPPLGAKELIRDADLKFVQYLAQQLDVAHQAQLGGEFGFGQGYMVKAPTATAWKRKKGRARFAEWLLALGFTSRATVNRYLYRIASLRADIILRELHRRVVPNTLAEVNDAEDRDVDMDAKPKGTTSATTETPLDTTISMDSLESEPSLQGYKDHFSALDSQKLEILSLSEHDRILSSSRHMEIADAMEQVLAQPSARKEKSRARRLSKLGRIAAGRRISLVPIASSTLLPSLVEDDMEWDEGEAEDDLAPLPRESVGVVDSDSLGRSSVGRASSLGRASAGKLSFGRRASSLTRTTMTRSSLPGTTSVPRASMSRSSMTRALSGRRSSIEQSHHLLHKKKLQTDNVLRLVIHSKLVPVAALRNVLRNVSASWRSIANIAYAWAMADYANQSRKSMLDLYPHYPRGHYLSDGAYKEVHKVYSTRHKRLEAISVMDIGAIESTGNQSVVRQEIAHTILLSELVQSKFCPNFLAMYDMFVSSERPRADRWGSAEHRKPSDILTDRRLSVDPASLAAFRESGMGSTNGLYQYIQMEFCDGGDLEDFISLQDDKLLPLKRVVLPFFFQMVFSVYCARERFHFRHCDIKLLNFFLKDIGRQGMNKEQDEDMTLQYFVEDKAFDLRLPVTFSYWIKLADYGTADSNVDSLGKPVALDQFTTLENSPVEFLLEGDAAVQSFASDTFSLGLCLLHLFTGSAPYEEILEDVRCPVDLMNDLNHVWTNPRKNSGYTVLKRVVKDDPENVLHHTLYRFVVLFGLPEENPSSEKGVDKVWRVLLKHLRPEAVAPAAPARRSRSATASARAAAKSVSVKHLFEQDRAKYSLANGSDPMIQRGRARMEAVPGAIDVLTSLVDFNPAKRPTMKSVLLHPLFASLQTREPQRKPADYVIDAYKRSALIPDV